MVITTELPVMSLSFLGDGHPTIGSPPDVIASVRHPRPRIAEGLHTLSNLMQDTPQKQGFSALEAKIIPF
jgi:hypothetical protein